jgi:hypothetical protein
VLSMDFVYPEVLLVTSSILCTLMLHKSAFVQFYVQGPVIHSKSNPHPPSTRPALGVDAQAYRYM